MNSSASILLLAVGDVENFGISTTKENDKRESKTSEVWFKKETVSSYSTALLCLR